MFRTPHKSASKGKLKKVTFHEEEPIQPLRWAAMIKVNTLITELELTIRYADGGTLYSLSSEPELAEFALPLVLLVLVFSQGLNL
jgi:hypothetical protein